MNIGKCGMKANVVSEENTFPLYGNHRNMPPEDLK